RVPKFPVREEPPRDGPRPNPAQEKTSRRLSPVRGDGGRGQPHCKAERRIGMRGLAAIGECMIELSEHRDGRITRAFGGDTLNTAVYLARLGMAVDYITALGDDPWSDEMLSAWQAEGVGTGSVIRSTGRLPGLYIIQTDDRGERRFSYWRD